MEQSLCPVSIKTGGPWMKESPITDGPLFQELISAGMAESEKEENPEMIKDLKAGGDTKKTTDVAGDQKQEGIEGLEHLMQGFMVKEEVQSNGTAVAFEGEILREAGLKSMDPITQNAVQGLEEKGSDEKGPEGKSSLEKPMVFKGKFPEKTMETVSRENPSLEMESEENLSQFKEALAGSLLKQGAKEQEKPLNYLQQEGIKLAGEAVIKDAPKMQVSEPVLAKNLETFEREMIKSFETIEEGETTLLKIKLEPESLGKVDIQLRMEDGKLKGSIIVENDRIRELFGDRLTELGARLSQQNIPVDELKVEVAQEPFQAPMNMSHEGRQGQPRHPQKRGYQNSTLRKIAEFQRRQEERTEGISILA